MKRELVSDIDRLRLAIDNWGLALVNEMQLLREAIVAINIDRKDEPQTETQTETQNSNLTFEKRTMRDCYNCKRYETEEECVECHYKPKDEPQTDCAWK